MLTVPQRNEAIFQIEPPCRIIDCHGTCLNPCFGSESDDIQEQGTDRTISYTAGRTSILSGHTNTPTSGLQHLPSVFEDGRLVTALAIVPRTVRFLTVCQILLSEASPLAMFLVAKPWSLRGFGGASFRDSSPGNCTAHARITHGVGWPKPATLAFDSQSIFCKIVWSIIATDRGSIESWISYVGRATDGSPVNRSFRFEPPDISYLSINNHKCRRIRQSPMKEGLATLGHLVSGPRNNSGSLFSLAALRRFRQAAVRRRRLLQATR